MPSGTNELWLPRVIRFANGAGGAGRLPYPTKMRSDRSLGVFNRPLEGTTTMGNDQLTLAFAALTLLVAGVHVYYVHRGSRATEKLLALLRQLTGF